MLNIAVFISGEGTNLKAIYKACEEGVIDGEIKIVIADKVCDGLVFAEEQDICTRVFYTGMYSNREQWNSAILAEIEPLKIDLVCLAGFMKVVNSTFVERYRGSILNLHPGVLPLLAGKDPQKKALDLKLKSTGNTIHIVTEKIDDSSCIIGTDEVFIDERETEESLSIKLKEKGHETYIRAINTWIQLYKNR